MSTISFKSLSDPSVEYSVDLDGLTCSCEHFLNRTYRFNRDDPRRLCKHLIRTVIQYGIPEYLKQHENEIAFFAARGMAFSNRNKLRRNVKVPLEPGNIETITANKKVKYLYLSGKADEKIIEATIDLKTGETTFQINGYWGSYNPGNGKIALRQVYEYLKNAMKYWLDTEYTKVIKLAP